MTREMADNFPERGYGAERPEAVEILPLDIGDLPADEVVPLLERAASRIEIVKPENEFWQGMKENLEGAASYIKAKKGELASKTFRAIAGASLVTSMLSACAEPGLTPKATEIHRTSEPVATEVVSVPTPEPTATKESPPTPVTVASGRPYPVTDADFFLGAGGAENDEERLRELGAGPDIDKIRAMGVAEMERSGINPENIEWITELNEQAESPSWTTMPRNKTTGHFLFPKITSGPEAGQLVRAGSIFAYLDREIGDDFFDWIELQNPEGMENLEQRLIGDRSGWIVIGAFNTEGKMLFWFNAEKDEWVPASDFVPEGIDKVELKDGEWVAVDSEGKIRKRFNTEIQEWEAIKRQVGCPEISGAEGYLSPDILKPLPENQINRLYTLKATELEEVPFGVGVVDIPMKNFDGVSPIRELTYFEDGEYIGSILFVSGIYRGVFSIEPEWALRIHTYLVLEVPLETGDPITTFLLYPKQAD